MIRMQGEQIRAFRVKEIEPEQLLTVIEFLKGMNFKFHRSKLIRSSLAHILLKAFFQLHQIDDNIYENSDSRGLYYLNIPELLEWTIFEKLITYQKSNSKFVKKSAWTRYGVKKAFIDYQSNQSVSCS